MPDNIDGKICINFGGIDDNTGEMSCTKGYKYTEDADNIMPCFLCCNDYEPNPNAMNPELLEASILEALSKHGGIMTLDQIINEVSPNMN
jgi:hypothetical protein